MTNSTPQAKTMELESNEIAIRLRFDRPLGAEEAARMAGAMARRRARRAQRLQALLGLADPDPEVVAILVGSPGRR